MMPSREQSAPRRRLAGDRWVGVTVALVAVAGGVATSTSAAAYTPGGTQEEFNAQYQQQLQEWMDLPVSSSPAKGPVSSSTWNLTALPGTNAYAGMVMPRPVRVLNVQGPVVVAGVANFDDSTPDVPGDDTLVISAPQGITFLPGPAPSGASAASPRILQYFGFTAFNRRVVYDGLVNLVAPNHRYANVVANVVDSTWDGAQRAGSWTSGTFLGTFDNSTIGRMQFQGAKSINLIMTNSALAGADFSTASATFSRTMNMILVLSNTDLWTVDGNLPDGTPGLVPVTFRNRTVKGSISMTRGSMLSTDFSSSTWTQIQLTDVIAGNVTFDGVTTKAGTSPFVLRRGTYTNASFKNMRAGSSQFLGTQFTRADFTGNQAGRWNPVFTRDTATRTPASLDTSTFDISSFSTGSAPFRRAVFRGTTFNGVDLSNTAHQQFISRILNGAGNSFRMSRVDPTSRGLIVRAGTAGEGTQFVRGTAPGVNGKIFRVVVPPGAPTGPFTWQQVDSETLQDLPVPEIADNPVAGEGP